MTQTATPAPVAEPQPTGHYHARDNAKDGAATANQNGNGLLPGLAPEPSMVQRFREGHLKAISEGEDGALGMLWRLVEFEHVNLAHTVYQMPLSVIEALPFEPRRHLDEAGLDELAAEIKEDGVRQPILLRPHPRKEGHFQRIYGQRRHLASQRAGLATVPAMIQHMDDVAAMETALVENEQRQHMNPMDRAWSYRKLAEMGQRTQQQIASKIGKTQGFVGNYIGLTHLPEEIQQHIMDGTLTVAHGVALLTVNKIEGKALQMANEAIERSWNSGQMETACRAVREIHDKQGKLFAEQQEIAKNATATDTEGETYSLPQERLNSILVDVQSLMNGKAKLFDYDGQQYVCSSSLSQGHLVQELSAYRVVPKDDFEQPTRSYGEAMSDPNRFDEPAKILHGVLVKSQGKSYVLVGPRVTFVPEQPDAKASTPATSSTPTPATATAGNPVCRECGQNETAIQATGGHMTKIDLCSACDPEYQAAQQAMNETASNADNSDENANKSASTVDKAGEGQDNSTAASSQSTPASTSGKAESKDSGKTESKTTTQKPEIPKVPEGFTATFVPTADTNFIQDKGVSVPQAMQAVRKLLELGEPLGLGLDDMILTIEAYLNDDEDESDDNESDVQVVAHDEAVVGA